MYYLLEGKVPKKVTLTEWVNGNRYRDDADDSWRVARTEIGDITISTVFLGLDHNHDGPPPLVFETMVFGGPMNDWCERYSTWEEAEKGHQEVVDKVNQTLASVTPVCP